LNGDGGDELFGGYEWYRTIHRFNQVDLPIGRLMAGALLSAGRNLLPRRVRRGMELLAMEEPARFQSLRSFITARDRADLYHDEFRNGIASSTEGYLEDLYDCALTNDYDRSFSADFESYLPEDLLVKVDRASMAHGLECRSPFLDQELVEFAASLPPEWKIDATRSKRILKDAVTDWFPAGFLDRPKMGFAVPVGKWFRGELKRYISDKLLNGPLGRLPLLRRPALERLLAEHFNGVRDHETHIWNLLMLTLWCEEHGVDG
jgi:asparagine synthase (glutamine-hydrolysing)